jgi:tetratricopeptide (TPR) repeat protein
MKRVVLALLLAAGLPPRAAVETELAAALRRYDAEAAVAALGRARDLDRAVPGPATALLRVRAALVAAELLRVQFEQAPPNETQQRAVLGQRIDAAAEEGLAVLQRVPPSSERYRMEADLLATMIRSTFRARTYEARFASAVAKALELDPRNARAHVTAAKPLVFAPPEHGRDLRAAVGTLTRALELDPTLEPALLLRALAYELLGEHEAALADWRAALAANPECTPAREALAQHRR